MSGRFFTYGVRFDRLGSSTDLVVAAPLADGSTAAEAHTDAQRIGFYFSRTPASEYLGFVVMGTATLKVYADRATILDNTVWHAGNFDPSNYQALSLKGVANGYASLDSTGRVPASQLPPSGGFTILDPPARVLGTANLTLSGLQTVDGVTLDPGDRILLIAQSTPAENGLWVASAGAWTRPTDFDDDLEVIEGLYALIEQGSLNGGSSWVLTEVTGTFPANTTMVWSQFAMPAVIEAGDGLSKTGTLLSVNVDSSTIEINTDILRIKDAGVTYAKLQNVAGLSVVGRAANTSGVAADITAGTDHQVLRRSGTSLGFGALALNQSAAVTGTLAVANGGTGGATEAAARTSLGVPRYYAANVGAVVANTVTITHNLGTTDVVVDLFEISSGDKITPVMTRAANSITLTFNTASIPADTYRVLILGLGV